MMEEEIGQEIWQQIPWLDVKNLVDREWEGGIKKNFDGAKRSRYVTLSGNMVTLTGKPSVLIST